MTQIYPAQYVTTAVVEKPCYKALLYFLYLWKLFFFWKEVCLTKWIRVNYIHQGKQNTYTLKYTKYFYILNSLMFFSGIFIQNDVGAN